MSDRKQEPEWRQSSQRCGTGACVQVAKLGDEYLVRDSKNPQTAPFAFSAQEWRAFVAGVRRGDFEFE